MPRILCVEDELGFREDLVEYLRLKQFQVDEASNGQEALKLLAQSTYDLVLSDINMPQMGGFELLMQSRQHTDAPFIFLTALSDRHDHVKGRDLGCEDYLTKPVDFEVLVASLKARLAHQQAQKMRVLKTELSGQKLFYKLLHEELVQPLYAASGTIDFLCQYPKGQPLAPMHKVLAEAQRSIYAHMQQIDLLSEAMSDDSFYASQHHPFTFSEAFLKQFASFVAPASLEVRVLGTPESVFAEPSLLSRSLIAALRTRAKSLPPQWSAGLILAQEAGQITLCYSDVMHALACPPIWQSWRAAIDAAEPQYFIGRLNVLVHAAATARRMGARFDVALSAQGLCMRFSIPTLATH